MHQRFAVVDEKSRTLFTTDTVEGCEAVSELFRGKYGWDDLRVADLEDPAEAPIVEALAEADRRTERILAKHAAKR